MIKKVKELVKLVKNDGWYFVRQNGSHEHYWHPTKKGTVTIPNHGLNEDLNHKLVASILKQAGLK